MSNGHVSLLALIWCKLCKASRVNQVLTVNLVILMPHLYKHLSLCETVEFIALDVDHHYRIGIRNIVLHTRIKLLNCEDQALVKFNDECLIRKRSHKTFNSDESGAIAAINVRNTNLHFCYRDTKWKRTSGGIITWYSIITPLDRVRTTIHCIFYSDLRNIFKQRIKKYNGIDVTSAPPKRHT
jgi:hypothetical protein